jgi:hypothetical protein
MTAVRSLPDVPAKSRNEPSFSHSWYLPLSPSERHVSCAGMILYFVSVSQQGGYNVDPCKLTNFYLEDEYRSN